MKQFIKEYFRELINETNDDSIDLSKIRIKSNTVNNLLVFTPFYNGKPIGAFRLKHFGDDYKVHGTVLYDGFKHKGIGKNMYRYIIRKLSNDNKKLYSDDFQSPDAQNVWNSLIRNGLAKKTETGFVSI